MGIIDQQAWNSIEFTCAFYADRPKVRNIHQKQATPGCPKLAQADPESVPRRYQLIPDAIKSSLCWYKMENFENMKQKFKNSLFFENFELHFDILILGIYVY